MRGINKVFILGNLGHDPELKQTANGTHYADLRIATNRTVRHQDSWSESVDWHHVRTWEQTAELCMRMLTKGCMVAVEGQLRTDSWLDTGGEKRYKTYIHASRLHFLSPQRAIRAKETV